MSHDLIFGMHASKQFLHDAPDKVLEVLVQQGPVQARLNEELNLASWPVQVLEKKALDVLCDGGNHQGIVLRVRKLEQQNEKALDAFLKNLPDAHSPLFLVLDNITDPHNLGACLRSAAAAKVDAVILPKDKSVGINATVRKVAAGAADNMTIFVVTNLARSMDKLKAAGIWIVGTAIDEQAQNLYLSELTGPLAIVMGSEGEGMRRLTRDKCDFLCYLPMSGKMQSLNVSVATGVCLFEALRQRGAFKSM